MKYMGSKSRFAKAIYAKICELSPRNGRPWVEPFAGRMNMICEVPHEDGPRYANDLNKYVVEMFKAGTNGWKPPEKMDSDFYNSIKQSYKNNDGFYEDCLIGYAGIAASYCGKWFGGFAGVVDTKSSGIVDYYGQSFRTFEKQVKKLNEVWFCSAPYDKLIIPANSIVYCDPPYEGTTKYKDDFNHAEFWNWIRQISKEHDVFISEYNAPSDFECVWQSVATSSLSANGKSGGSKQSIEKLFRLKNV